MAGAGVAVVRPVWDVDATAADAECIRAAIAAGAATGARRDFSGWDMEREVG